MGDWRDSLDAWNRSQLVDGWDGEPEDYAAHAALRETQLEERARWHALMQELREGHDGSPLEPKMLANGRLRSADAL